MIDSVVGFSFLTQRRLTQVKVKVKFTLEKVTKAQRWEDVWLYSFFNLGAGWGMGGQGYAPAALPPGSTAYSLYRRLGGDQGRSGRVRKISPPPGFDPQTVQPVASRHTDWGIPAHCLTQELI